MKIFLSYRFTGEDYQQVKEMLDKVSAILRFKNHLVYCSLDHLDFFKNNKFTTNQIYNYCNHKLTFCDTVLGIITSDQESKGMKLELKMAKKLGKNYVLLIKQGSNHQEFRRLADNVIEYKNLTETLSNLIL